VLCNACGIRFLRNRTLTKVVVSGAGRSQRSAAVQGIARILPAVQGYCHQLQQHSNRTTIAERLGGRKCMPCTSFRKVCNCLYQQCCCTLVPCLMLLDHLPACLTCSQPKKRRTGGSNGGAAAATGASETGEDNATAAAPTAAVEPEAKRAKTAAAAATNAPAAMEQETVVAADEMLVSDHATAAGCAANDVEMPLAEAAEAAGRARIAAAAAAALNIVPDTQHAAASADDDEQQEPAVCTHLLAAAAAGAAKTAAGLCSSSSGSYGRSALNVCASSMQQPLAGGSRHVLLGAGSRLGHSPSLALALALHQQQQQVARSKAPGSPVNAGTSCAAVSGSPVSLTSGYNYNSYACNARAVAHGRDVASGSDCTGGSGSAPDSPLMLRATSSCQLPILGLSSGLEAQQQQQESPLLGGSTSSLLSMLSSATAAAPQHLAPQQQQQQPDILQLVQQVAGVLGGVGPAVEFVKAMQNSQAAAAAVAAAAAAAAAAAVQLWQ
jgi:hypothetical protein